MRAYYLKNGGSKCILIGLLMEGFGVEVTTDLQDITVEKFSVMTKRIHIPENYYLKLEVVPYHHGTTKSNRKKRK